VRTKPFWKEKINYLRRKRVEGKQVDVVLKQLHQSVTVSPHKNGSPKEKMII